jgi:hypothetical protein
MQQQQQPTTNRPNRTSQPQVIPNQAMMINNSTNPHTGLRSGGSTGSHYSQVSLATGGPVAGRGQEHSSHWVASSAVGFSGSVGAQPGGSQWLPDFPQPRSEKVNTFTFQQSQQIF